MGSAMVPLLSSYRYLIPSNGLSRVHECDRRPERYTDAATDHARLAVTTVWLILTIPPINEDFPIEKEKFLVICLPLSNQKFWLRSRFMALAQLFENSSRRVCYLVSYFYYSRATLIT